MERIRAKLLKSVRGAENHHHPNKAEVDLFRRRRENLVVGICICLPKELADPSIISI